MCGPKEVEFWDLQHDHNPKDIKAFERVLWPNWYLCWNLTILGDLLVQRDELCELRVTLPTRQQVTVSAGIVRWVRGAECGIETLVMSTQAEARLGDYIRVCAST